MPAITVYEEERRRPAFFDYGALGDAAISAQLARFGGLRLLGLAARVVSQRSGVAGPRLEFPARPSLAQRCPAELLQHL